MPEVLGEDQLRRKKALKEKRAARRAAKAQKEEQAASSQADQSNEKVNAQKDEDTQDKRSDLVWLPEDALHVLFNMLSAAELGRLTMTCKHLNQLLNDARISYLVSRLNRPSLPTPGTVGYIEMCTNQAQARELLEQSYNGGDTGRILPRGKYSKTTNNEFISYARFLEEAVCGYSTLTTGVITAEPIFLPRFVQGRFASVSPEHSLCRVGGDSTSGAGGSGTASWGVGRRGQLGHGKRQDERLPRRLMGGLGYGIRIVQVAAGGGLVRVAHSLLLTSTGRVLSFGTGQYGALGHGYSAARQLPDMLRPEYVTTLSSVRCVCVAAGELHSAVVTSDGDVYTWGDGFCGQLGHGDKRPQTSPKQVTLGGLEDEVVASINCGSRHTLAVTEDGEVFSWGLGHFGALGRSFTPFDYDADAAVVALGTGEDAPLINPMAQGGAMPPVVPPLHGGNMAETGERDMDAELMAHLDLIANLSLDDSSDQCLPMVVESLQGIKIVGSSAGHRHSLLLDENGSLYSFGAGLCGCLGHGDTERQMYPMNVIGLEQERVRIMQMSAGVDMSMAVSTTGDVYAWGKVDGGRIGLGFSKGHVTQPRQVSVKNADGKPVKAVDVECGYVHSIIVGLDGTIHMCGGVGIEGAADGQEDADSIRKENLGLPRQVPDFNIWHRLPEPKEEVKKERWKKCGKYEVKGRRKMMEETKDQLI